MKIELETKFYEFSQNNSGGSFDVDENVCHRVVIEAIDAKHAQSIFEPMIENQTPSCTHCGARWSSYEPYEIELSKRLTIEQYCQVMANADGCTVPDIRIHFLGGAKKEIFKLDMVS